MNTKTRMFAVALLAALASPAAFAQGKLTVASVAAEAGLSARQVQMVLGAHAAFGEYRTSFARARAQLVRSIGQDRYEELIVAFREGTLELGNS